MVALGALAAWTVFLWGQRLANAWSGDESTAAKLTSTALAVVFFAFVVAAATILVRFRRTPLDRPGAAVLMAFALWTTGVWTVRVVLMSLADHSVGFKVVHAVLGLISIGLALVVARHARRRWSPEPVAG
jgi:hypothetical protein